MKTNFEEINILEINKNKFKRQKEEYDEFDYEKFRGYAITEVIINDSLFSLHDIRKILLKLNHIKILKIRKLIIRNGKSEIELLKLIIEKCREIEEIHLHMNSRKNVVYQRMDFSKSKNLKILRINHFERIHDIKKISKDLLPISEQLLEITVFSLNDNDLYKFKNLEKIFQYIPFTLNLNKFENLKSINIPLETNKETNNFIDYLKKFKGEYLDLNLYFSDAGDMHEFFSFLSKEDFKFINIFHSNSSVRSNKKEIQMNFLYNIKDFHFNGDYKHVFKNLKFNKSLKFLRGVYEFGRYYSNLKYNDTLEYLEIFWLNYNICENMIEIFVYNYSIKKIEVKNKDDLDKKKLEILEKFIKRNNEIPNSVFYKFYEFDIEFKYKYYQ